VLAPTQVLGQLVEMLDADLLPFDMISQTERAQVIADTIAKSLRDYPPEISRNAEILFAHRNGERMAATFHLHSLVISGFRVSVSAIAIPTQASAILVQRGSGAAAFAANLAKWQKTAVGGTSRSMFCALVDALREKADRSSGPPPQLVGLYRIGPGRVFGIIWENQAYYYGTQCAEAAKGKGVQWHNDLFEVCDPETLERQLEAQPQPRPPELVPD
jgi:hypothetical protein